MNQLHQGTILEIAQVVPKLNQKLQQQTLYRLA